MAKTITTLAVFTVLLLAGGAHAATDELKCRAGRAKAAGKYQACVNKWLANVYDGYVKYEPLLAQLAKCRIKYAAAWSKLQSLSGSATCGGQPRFVDTGEGTIVDNLTGLEWEKKSDAADVHDKDLVTTWSTGAPHRGDGSAFTGFLGVAPDSLNEAGAAGAHDWRLPTLAELLTILRPEPYPCTTNPCVDAVFATACVPTCTAFACSCTEAENYWSATTYVASDPGFAWSVNFATGFVGNGDKTVARHVRAVRGGL